MHRIDRIYSDKDSLSVDVASFDIPGTWPILERPHNNYHLVTNFRRFFLIARSTAYERDHFFHYHHHQDHYHQLRHPYYRLFVPFLIVVVALRLRRYPSRSLVVGPVFLVLCWYLKIKHFHPINNNWQSIQVSCKNKPFF